MSHEFSHPTPTQAREDWLLRTLLLEHLLTHVELRRAFVLFLAHRATASVDQRTTARHLDATCHAWTLSDNLLSIYETLAGKVNITQESQRQAIQSRIGGRTTTPKIRFYKSIWLYQQLSRLPDEVFERAHVDRPRAELILNGLIQRSCATLQDHYSTIAAYHRKYREIAAAYKHGRAVFPLHLTLQTISDTGESELNTQIERSVISVFHRKPDGSETVIEFTPDDESEKDLREVLRIAGEQLPRLRGYVGSVRRSLHSYIGWLESGQPPGIGPGPTFSFFAEPYSSEEEALMQKLRSTSTP